MSDLYVNGTSCVNAPHSSAAPPPPGYVPPPAVHPTQPVAFGKSYKRLAGSTRSGAMMPPGPPPPPMGVDGVGGGVPPYPGPATVIAKGPSAPTAPVGYSSNVVPGLMDTLMMPAAVSLPAQEPDPPPMVNVVYVGGLYSGTSSDFVINIMQVSLTAGRPHDAQKCGKLVNFKRHADPSSGLLANFALCEFESPRGAYYALECLAGQAFGEGQVKVSCNDKVKGLVEAWVAEQLAALREEHQELNDEELRQLFKAPEAELRREFENLIKYEVLAVQGSGAAGTPAGPAMKAEAQRTSRRADGPRADSAAPGKSTEPATDPQVTSREYTIHPKESARRSKWRARQRADDELLKTEERKWLEEEASMLRKLHRVGVVKRSTRERLVKDDMDGFARSTSSREREKERELDLLDAQAEAAEAAAAEPRCTIPLAAPAAPQAPAEAPKRALPTVFSAAADEEEPIFNRSHRPKIRLGVPDSELWERVPTGEADVFAFALDWDRVLSDGSLVSSLEPWMRRCVTEFMGDDESVVGEVLEFLAGRLVERPAPAELLSEVEQFLDEESRGFVLELWRRLIFHQLQLGALSAD
ncbi:PWI domain-containing protein [Babesia caballi]|uniref:PWI domain-containing protein n=1 Tax=Babesia caballi TaxID=5871 RepID=A0AAV4LXA1_BABCB|nr:PWI domain-containing protein [Babesia caballi]